jgi:hypothetical protein
MTTFHVEPRCTSVKFSDGTVYPVDRPGRVTIDNPAHAAEVATSCQVRYGYMGLAPYTFIEAKGKHCSRCSFHAFTWTQTCPRCGDRAWDTEVVSDSLRKK